MTEQHSPTDEQLGKEIEDLDREAREALDRLADRGEELERMSQERLQLEERAEEQAAGLVATLEELLAFDRRHRRALAPAGFSVYDAPPDLAGEISWWFRGFFGGVVPDLGSDVRAPGYGKAGPSLPERDPLTPTASEAPRGEAHEAKPAEE
jgi:hypothetical protein